MDYTKQLKRLADTNPLLTPTSRRQILRGMGAGAATLGAMAACPSFASAQDRALNILTWDGYMDPRLLDGFRDQYGSSVNPEGHVSDPTSVNRLRAGETAVWDFINVNNPWARQIMWPEQLIIDLPRDRFEPYFEKMAAKFKPPYKWAMSIDGEHLLGVCQRYETFDFVINTDSISVETAQSEGWDMFNDPAMEGRYGILTYDNWNVIHICMGAGIHPFKEKSEEDIQKFEETARRWINGAKLLNVDFVQLNQAMLNGEIDAYITGGTYTVSAARLEGVSQLYAVCPESGPADGFGGVNWIEVNSAVNNPNLHPNALDFLEYILQPESAYIVGTAGGLLQPVAQMAQPEVFEKFTTDELNAIQYDSLDYRISHAVEYDIVPGEDRLMEIYGAAMRDRG